MNMKRVVLLIFFTVTGLTLFSQEKLSFEKVIQVDSLVKDKIYFGLKNWISTAYVSSKEVLEMDDKDAGLLVLSTRQTYSFGKLYYICYDGYLDYKVKIQIKDYRFKITVTNFIHTVLPSNNYLCALGLLTTDLEYKGKGAWGAKPYNDKVWADLINNATNISNNLFSIISKINFDNPTKKDDNW